VATPKRSDRVLHRRRVEEENDDDKNVGEDAVLTREIVEGEDGDRHQERPSLGLITHAVKNQATIAKVKKQNTDYPTEPSLGSRGRSRPCSTV
jgi:hypothetical protein